MMQTQEEINKDVLGQLISLLQLELGRASCLMLLDELHQLDNDLQSVDTKE